MMTAPELNRRARELGLRLEPRGDKLIVTPGDRCPADFAAILREHKGELLDWLNRPPCPGWRTVPPAALPLNPLPPCPSPADARRVVDFIARQTNGTDALCEWALRRELAYWTAYHWTDEVCCYATSRDAACWQLGATEADCWITLETFDDLSKQNTP